MRARLPPCTQYAYPRCVCEEILFAFVTRGSALAAAVLLSLSPYETVRSPLSLLVIRIGPRGYISALMPPVECRSRPETQSLPYSRIRFRHRSVSPMLSPAITGKLPATVDEMAIVLARASMQSP